MQSFFDRFVPYTYPLYLWHMYLDMIASSDLTLGIMVDILQARLRTMDRPGVENEKRRRWS